LSEDVLPQAYPGIQANLTATGLNQLEAAIQPIVQIFLNGKSFPLAPIINSKFGVSLNFTNIQLYDLNFGGLTMDMINGQGIQMTLQGLTGHMSYNLSYEIEVSFLSGTTFAVANLNETDVVLLFSFKDNGKGIPVITVPSMTVDIGYINLGLAEFLTYYAQPVVDTILDEVIPPIVKPILDSTIAGKLADVTMTMFLDPWNKTMIDFGFLGDPVITGSYALFNLKGSIHPVQDTCPTNITQMAPIADRPICFYLSTVLVDCLIYSFQKTGVLNQLVAQEVGKYVPLDNRVNLSFNFTNTNNTVDVVPSNIIAHLELDFGVDRLLPTQERMVTMDIQLRTQVQLSFNPANVSLVGAVKYLTTAFKLMQFSKDLPDDYKKEINQTNFGVLSQEADMFINKTVLPQLNGMLAKGFQIPEFAAQFLSQPELLIEKGYLYFGTSFKPPFQTGTVLNLHGTGDDKHVHS